MCRHFAAAGDRVVVASRKRDACETLARELREAHGGEALGIGCHVGSWSQCDELIDEVLDRFGRIDVLVNNAGMSPLYPSLTEVTEELFDKVLSVNLRGPFRLSVRAAEAMKRTGSGSIVNVGSVAALVPQAHDLPYAMAKSALDTMTIGLARSLGPTVRVNGVMAGPFDTDVTAAWTEETLGQVAGERIPMGRIGQPDEIVGAVDYLVGPAAGYTTGAIIRVDGGMAARSS